MCLAVLELLDIDGEGIFMSGRSSTVGDVGVLNPWEEEDEDDIEDEENDRVYDGADDGGSSSGIGVE